MGVLNIEDVYVLYVATILFMPIYIDSQFDIQYVEARTTDE